MSSPDSPAPDGRPRPAYGEYATPEQQRAAIRQPAAPAASAGFEAGAASHGPSQSEWRGADAGGLRAPHRPSPHATTTAARPSRTADRVITLALLAYGFVTVVSAVPQLWQFAEFAETWMKLAGIDATFTNIAQGNLWGRIASGVFVFGWLVTAALSWWTLRRRRLAWWIPPVGAIVTFGIVTICLMVPLLGDPAIYAHFAA